MHIESKIPVQNDAQKMRIIVDRVRRLPMERAGCQILLLVQVEKGQTSPLSAFEFNFHCLGTFVGSNQNGVNYGLKSNFCIFLLSSLRIEITSANSTLTESSESEVGRLLM